MNEMTRARMIAILRLSLLVIAMGIVLGGLAAPLWHSMVTLPTYTVGSDGAATTTEKGLTQVFSTDATYCLIGLVVGLIIGCLSWVLMRRRGAWGVLAAGISACLSALACWWVGVLIGRTLLPNGSLQLSLGRLSPSISLSIPGWQSWYGCSLPWCPCSSRPCWRPDVALRGPDAQRRRPGLH